jgi:SAM-dependent methyltransferase
MGAVSVVEDEGVVVMGRARIVLWAKETKMRARAKAGALVDWILWKTSKGSNQFWERHYAVGGSSGPGSRGSLADAKAEVVNRIIESRNVESVVEFGCGDGYQLGLLRPPRYIGVDVSASAIEMCRKIFRADESKRFIVQDRDKRAGRDEVLKAEMALSMDVIYHLVDQDGFERYMTDLFNAAQRLVLIYSTDEVNWRSEPEYTCHRPFSNWVSAHATGWRLSQTIANPYPDLSRCSFFLYERSELAVKELPVI